MANLIPWRTRRPLRGAGDEPGNSLTKFRTQLDRMFDRFFEDPWSDLGETFQSAELWTPSIDVVDNDQTTTIRAEIPGVDTKDIDIRVSGNYLTLAGRKDECKEDKSEDYYHCERRFGSFRRTIELPAPVDADKVTAEHANGVLTIRVPKPEHAKRRHIEVKPAREQKTGQRVPVGAA